MHIIYNLPFFLTPTLSLQLLLHLPLPDETQPTVCLPQLRSPRNDIVVLLQVLRGSVVVVHPGLGPRLLAHLRAQLTVVARVLLVLEPVGHRGHQRHVHVHAGRGREADVVDGHGPLGSSHLPAVGQTCLLLLYAGRVNGRPGSGHQLMR